MVAFREKGQKRKILAIFMMETYSRYIFLAHGEDNFKMFIDDFNSRLKVLTAFIKYGVIETEFYLKSLDGHRCLFPSLCQPFFVKMKYLTVKD